MEPPPSSWRLPSADEANAVGIVGVGADLEPGTLLQAYRQGLFPMPVSRGGPIGWWSPDPRGVLPHGGLRISRSLERARSRYEVRVDSAFSEVVDACADPSRPGGWITADVKRAYGQLHELGWAHSIEAWDGEGLAGGLYGVAIGGLFAGESMFHRRTDASKVALVELVERLRADTPGARLLDVQWRTDHLASLGAIEVARPDYMERLAVALAAPLPTAWA
ncbi:MAG: leucyl/phenylalanyl-tRNA--protein transferase [Acidimicrobiales bacterium]